MKLLVSPAPHKISSQSVNDMYITISIALFACLSVGFINYGVNVLLIVATAVLSALASEILFNLIKTRQFDFPNLSCIVTGLVVACISPINMPWYFAAVASVIAIGSKYLFGGIGNNLFNPSALARSVLGCLALGFSFDYFGEGNTALKLILTGEKGSLELAKLFTGEVAGAIGTTCIIIILIAMVALIVLKVIRLESVAFALLSFCAVIWIAMGFENILPMLLSGSFLFVVVFMLGDPTTSSYSFSGRCVYAIVFGVIAALTMSHNVFGESAVFFALLIANLFAPMADRVFSIFHRGVKLND
ncbi:MAG: RnfABCDGE type electron transport complex subunit D [Clostridia bacterium]|nr:RnfABCDGE type electron transport complex subunit D [Clostridia bacterium]